MLPLAVLLLSALKACLRYRKTVVIERGRTARLRWALHTVSPELRASVIEAYATVEATRTDLSETDT